EQAAHVFFVADDGIRAMLVTGVQTCALPISLGTHEGELARAPLRATRPVPGLRLRSAFYPGLRDQLPRPSGTETPERLELLPLEIGRASSRERAKNKGAIVSYRSDARTGKCV